MATAPLNRSRDPRDPIQAAKPAGEPVRPGMQCLLELLRGQGGDRAIEDAEWETVLALAQAEHVLPWVVARARSQQVPLSPAIASRLNEIEREAAITAFYWSAELQGVLRAFERAGLKAVPLKGPLLAERLYGATALRVSYDLDLLVAKADMARAGDALKAIGFTSGVPDDYHCQWYRKGTTVELHHDVENPLAFNFRVEGALRRALSADFQGQPCRQLAADDELLYLCLHAVRHRFERLSLIVDLQLAFQKLAGGEDGFQLRPEVAGLASLLILGLAMARRLQPDLALTLQPPAAPARTRHLEGLADRLWNRLLTEPGQPPDWRALHAFYLELELPGWPRLGPRLRHLRILLGRVIEPDYAFAAKLGFYRTWQVRMLRPLRLLSRVPRR